VALSSKVKQKVDVAPSKPGVYQYYDKNKKFLYIGKAKNLKNRVGSYFNEGFKSGRTRLMVSKIEDIKYIVTNTEYDALLLENVLIKQHQPRFNVMLKDDKTYPWICIKKEPFPRIFKTRTLIKDGSEFYGPYASVKMMNTLLDMVRSTYKLRTCAYHLSRENIAAGKFKKCLEYHIGNCLAPCEDLQSEEDYLNSIAEIRSLIKGDFQTVQKELKARMKQYAENLDFEKAEAIRKKISIIERFESKSTVVNPAIDNVDVFTYVSDHDLVYINYMKVNKGSIVQGHNLEMKVKMDETQEELLSTAIVEMRERFNSNAREIIVPFVPDTNIEQVEYHVPQRGDKRKLLLLSEKNARTFMGERRKQQAKTDPERHSRRILEKMQSDLRLKELPRHIECFDNSNMQGSNPVAACVVFKDAKPSKKDYRHFNIKTVEGPDDFASMEEVVFRRYKRLSEEEQELPQLIVIDGGKGQLNAALKSLEQLGLRGRIAIVGIAKRLEEIFYPGDKYPLYLDKTSETLKVIQHLRNEAHRFGIKHHRNRRSKSGIHSELKSIPGIGEKSMQELLRKFKSVKRIKEASLEELSELLPLNRAQAVKKYFNGK
jgi:excinuclease ABC subunit C